MAVFTPVSDSDARVLLERYTIGELVSLRGITAGIENTNYFLNTTQGEYVLTLFEVLTHEQLPFYIELMHHLAERGIPVPEPQLLRDGGLNPGPRPPGGARLPYPAAQPARAAVVAANHSQGPALSGRIPVQAHPADPGRTGSLRRDANLAGPAGRSGALRSVSRQCAVRRYV
jgi:hypothetical protein